MIEVLCWRLRAEDETGRDFSRHANYRTDARDLQFKKNKRTSDEVILKRRPFLLKLKREEMWCGSRQLLAANLMVGLNLVSGPPWGANKCTRMCIGGGHSKTKQGRHVEREVAERYGASMNGAKRSLFVVCGRRQIPYVMANFISYNIIPRETVSECIQVTLPLSIFIRKENNYNYTTPWRPQWPHCACIRSHRAPSAARRRAWWWRACYAPGYRSIGGGRRRRRSRSSWSGARTASGGVRIVAGSASHWAPHQSRHRASSHLVRWLGEFIQGHSCAGGRQGGRSIAKLYIHQRPYRVFSSLPTHIFILCTLS